MQRRVLLDDSLVDELSESEPVRSAPLCFAARGFSMHAATRIDDDDRAGLERLIRYATRPPLAAGRLQIIDDEQLTFRLKTPSLPAPFAPLRRAHAHHRRAYR